MNIKLLTFVFPLVFNSCGIKEHNNKVLTNYVCSCDLSKAKGVKNGTLFEYNIQQDKLNKAELIVYLKFDDACLNYNLFFKETEDSLFKTGEIEGHDIFSSDSLRPYIENSRNRLMLQVLDTCNQLKMEYSVQCKKITNTKPIVPGH